MTPRPWFMLFRPEWLMKHMWKRPGSLGEALHLLRMEGVFYCHSEFTIPWGVEMPAMPGSAMFHVVLEGQARIEVPGCAPRMLEKGGFALVSRGEGHALLSEEGQSTSGLFELEREELTQQYERLCHGGGGELTTMICGAIGFENPMARRLMEHLPPVIYVDRWDTPESSWVQSALEMMAYEARGQRPGGDAVLTRLADIFVIQALRAWLEREPEARRGWLGAFQDPQIGAALACMHDAPGEAWTVARLAKEASMSRSAFAARFQELVGSSPVKYLTRWRMEVAWGMLREGAHVAQVASEMGYQSEAAFGRAFKRCLGVSPGASRRS